MSDTMRTTKRLGDVITLKRGHDLPESRRKAGQVPVVSSSGITGHHNEAKALPPGIVTGRYGTLGEVYYIEEPYWPLNTALYAVDFHGNDPLYLSFFLRQVLKGTQSNKAAVPGVNRNDLHEIKVQVPDLDEQTRIAATLRTYDELITNNRKRIKLLEESARLLYREWFVHFRFPGHGLTSATEQRLRDWTRTVVPEIISFNPHEVAPREGVRFVPMSSLSRNGMTIDTSGVTKREAGTNVKFRNCDTLLARITPCLENGKTAFVNFLNEGEVASGSTEFIVMRGKRVGQCFTYCYARSDEFRARAIASMTGSSGRQRVQIAAFNDIECLLPPASLLQSFEERAQPYFSSIGSLVASIDRLSTARSLLLPRLMSGELAV